MDEPTKQQIDEGVRRTKESICGDCGHTCSFDTMTHYCDAVEKEIKEVQEEDAAANGEGSR